MNFDDYYREEFGPRWEDLKRAMGGNPVYSELSAGLQTPYYLDQASRIAAEALGVQTGDRVLDMCAAPGGKSLILALAMGAEGRLIANDRSAARRNRLHRVLDTHLPESLRSSVTVTGHDATRWGLHESGVYDRILLDAPCSSERHVINSAPHLRQWSPGRSKRLAAQAFAMLCAALEALKPGGVLLYSTCALSPLENDGVLRRLHKKRAGRFHSLPPEAEAGETTEFGFQIWPDTAEGRGPIYMARLTKTEGESE